MVKLLVVKVFAVIVFAVIVLVVAMSVEATVTKRLLTCSVAAEIVFTLSELRRAVWL